ncbi:MAG: tail fiber domain-containing protein, partial [Nanoarchaeota archaeon]
KHSSGETIIYKARFSGTADFDDDIDVEGQILAADGTESLPSISFTNDTDTGLFSDGTLFLISVGGASRTSINNSGDIVTEGNVTAYGSVGSSDKRLKENIKPLSNSLDKVLSLRGVNFDYIGKNINQNGYIAQEVEKVMPEVVSEFECVKDKKMYKGIKYETIIPYLSESIKELKGIIDSQNKRIEELEKQLKG